MSEEKDKEIIKSSGIESEDILSAIDGIPLPPAIKKNLWKSLERLITGVVDIPVAYLESKSERIKGETTALNVFRTKVAEKASDEFMQDENLMNRAIDYYGSKLLKEQINRESIANKATDELKLNPPANDTEKEIDEDWIDMFSRISETKSNEEVQLILSKILAGEIKRPGSFGPKTLQTLTLLDQETAEIFRDFCSISYELPQLGDKMVKVISEPFGSPGSNALKDFNLNYVNLSQLQDAGLIQYDLTAWSDIHPALFATPFKIGNKIFQLSPIGGIDSKPIRTKVINFTRVGLELRRVLEMKSNNSYNETLIEWIRTRFKLK